MTMIFCANLCGNEIDARRAAIGRVGRQDFTLCPACNEKNLAPALERPSRSNATYDPHGHYLQGVG